MENQYNIDYAGFIVALAPLATRSQKSADCRVREAIAHALRYKYGLTLKLIGELLNRHYTTIISMIDNYKNFAINQPLMYLEHKATIEEYLRCLDNFVIKE